jgi:putative aldouronate transport system substrate-binding protein
MKKKLVSISLILAIVLTVGLAGCTKKENAAETDKGAQTAQASTAAEMDVSGKPDLSKKVTIEIMERGWVNGPLPPADKDVYKQWMEKTFNIELKFTNTSRFNEEITTRFASGNPPDIINFTDINLLRKLHSQGVLVDDWSKYLPSVPTIEKNHISEMAKLVLTENKKLLALPTSASPNIWGLQIRADWLKKLDLQMPKTPDELLNVLSQFAKNDLYGKGQKNTIGITSSDTKNGPNAQNFGGFTQMWGPMNWFVTADGKLSHSIVAGYQEKALQFLKKAVADGLADPDWATQSWDERKPKLYAGQIGTIWYPGTAVVMESYASKKTPVDAAEMWTTFASLPKGDEEGGKYTSGGYYTNLRSVSAQAEKDPVKMARILYILDRLSYPNDEYFTLRYGIGIDNVFLKDMANGYKYMYVDMAAVGKTSHLTPAVDDYATWIAANDKTYGGYTPEPDKYVLAGQAMDQKIIEADKYPNIKDLLVFDPKDSDATFKLWSQFYVNYITGKDTDYKGFVEKWLKVGGQKMIDEGTVQLKAIGIIK